jgi:hypothetical protein
MGLKTTDETRQHVPNGVTQETALFWLQWGEQNEENRSARSIRYRDTLVTSGPVLCNDIDLSPATPSRLTGSAASSKPRRYSMVSGPDPTPAKSPKSVLKSNVSLDCGTETRVAQSWKFADPPIQGAPRLKQRRRRARLRIEAQP